MENLVLLKIEQEVSSADADIRNAHNSVGCNLNSNRTSHSSPSNGISSFSGETRPCVISGQVDLLAAFMQSAQGRDGSQMLKNCETRWLQLFRLVEKQCQEQIVAQQKQFYHQIHRIQNEIRHLVKLQDQNLCSCTKRGSPNKLTSNFSSLGNQMGLQSETFEENELFVHQLKSNECESHLEASAVHQACLTNSVSLSSGYGTSSAAELSPSKSKDIRTCMENKEETDDKGLGGASSAKETLVTDSVQNKIKFTHKAIEPYPSLKHETIFSADFEHAINEGQRGDTNCSKSLTSWAEKLKQNQLKRPNVEDNVKAVKTREQTKKLTSENYTKPSAAAPSSYTFYLNQPNGSQNSLVSDTSGLTYWKLDEKDMYHSLPENFENEFSIFPTKVSSEQSSSGDEMKPTSLKEIYHQKQRESQQLADWNLCPLQSTHPPEILTLDPTLHMKPGQQNPGLPSSSFYGTPERVSFSPDSVAEPSFFIHSDTDSFSHTSTVASPLSESPKFASSTPALHRDPWNNCALPNEVSISSSCPVVYPDPNHETLNVEDEENLTLAPSLTTQSQLPFADQSLPDHNISVTCMEDPVVLSTIRQNLREKHVRHIADLRAYYDSEMQSLKQQLEASRKPSEDLKKMNQSLADRCNNLEAAVNEATNRMRVLENKNNTLEVDVANWRERFYAVNNTTKALEERLEEMRLNSKEKDNTISRLKRRLKELEEAFEKAYKLSDNNEARLKEENKMFQNLLGEHESLGKEHERVKDTLTITENKLLDAHTQMFDLRRTVSKLEVQIKQLEHENLLKFRHLADSHFRTSYANKLASSDVSRRKWLIPGAEHSIFTGQPLEGQENPKDNRLEEAFAACRQHSPPEKDSLPDPLLTHVTRKKEVEVPETPIIKAFKELEERKVLKSWGTQTAREQEAPPKPASRRATVGFEETTLGASRCSGKGKGQQHRQKRYCSPSGQRSSSLPPSNRKPNSPTRREIMLAPVAVTCSPKRSPKENLSPGFSHWLSKNENTVTRFNILLDDLEAAPTPASQCSNPRKRLQFLSVDGKEELQHASPGRDGCTEHSSSTPAACAGPAWEDENPARSSEPGHPSAALAPAPYEADLKYVSKLRTLAETERLFDELTQEKQQIEAQLSRVPCTGGRMTLQARLNQEALEDRLERINRELGSIRMILKRFHILRTSANS